MNYLFGTVRRPIKIKKRYKLSQYVLNLSKEASKWEKLTEKLEKRMYKNDGVIVLPGIYEE